MHGPLPIALVLILALPSPVLAQIPGDLPPGIPRTISDEVRRTSHLLLRGDVALLASSVGLVVAGIAEPARPRYLGGLLLPDAANGLALVGETLVIANGPQGLVLTDLRHPARPRRVGALRLAGAAMGVQGTGRLAVVACGTGGVATVDLSDPARPRRVMQLDTPGYARDVLIQGDRVFLADGEGGIRTYRLLAGRLTPLAHLATPGPVFGLALRDRQLLAAAGGAGVLLLELTADGLLRLRTRLPVRDAARGLSLSGARLAVADGTAGVMLADVSQPRAPRETGRFKPERSVNRLVWRGDLLFVANDAGGLLVLRAPATGDPTVVGALPAPARPR